MNQGWIIPRTSRIDYEGVESRIHEVTNGEIMKDSGGMFIMHALLVP